RRGRCLAAGAAAQGQVTSKPVWSPHAGVPLMRNLLVLLQLALFALLSTVMGSSAPPAAKAAEKPGLVVIAPRAFHPSLAPYLAHKKKQLPVELVALEDVCKGHAGDDDAERVKRFLFARWKDRRIGYVLLVGDIDVMPARYRTIIVGDGKKPPAYVFNL